MAWTDIATVAYKSIVSSTLVNAIIGDLYELRSATIQLGPFAFPYSAGWGNYEGGYLPVTYVKRGKRVYVEGLVRRTGATIASGSAAQTIGQLPVGYRPAGGSLSLVLSSSSPAGVDRLTINSDGTLQVQPLAAHAFPTNEFVSFFGISFDAA